MTDARILPDSIWVTGGCVIGPVAIDGPVAPLYPFEPMSLLGADRIRRLDPLSQYALVAVELAYENALLPRGASVERKSREGVTFGSALGPTVTSVRYGKRLVKAGPAATNPIDFPDCIDGSPAGHVALDQGLCGPSLTFVDGEQSAVAALVFAARLIAQGRVDRMVVVAGDYLDEVFCQVLASESQATGNPMGQAVLALVLERPGLRPVPPETVEFYGYAQQSALPCGTPTAFAGGQSGEGAARLRDPSGVLAVADAWLGAKASRGRALLVENPTYKGLSFLGRAGAERR